MRGPSLILTVVGGLCLVVSANGSIGSALVAIILGIIGGWLLCTGLVLHNRMAGTFTTGLFGMGVSLYLARQHLSAMHGGESICNIDATFDCDRVNTSEWSEMFGVPTALLAFAFYAGVTAIAYLGWTGGEKNRAAPRLIWIAGWFASLFSVVMAVYSFQLGTWCLFCISLYVVALTILSAGWAMRLEGADTWEHSSISAMFGSAGDSSMVSGVVAGLLCLVAGMVVYDGKANENSAAVQAGDPTALSGIYEAVAGEIVLDGTEATYGDKSAPYLLVEWADFQCGYCGKAATDLKKMIDANPQIQLRLKHYPLSAVCNEYIEGKRHEHACGAARAAECAGEQGLFWDLSSKMFKNQKYLSPTDISFMAKQVGLDTDALSECLTDDRSLRAVRDDIVHAKRADVHGTPALFMKGTHGETWIKVRPESAKISALVNAHQSGVSLPEPEAAEPHVH